MAKSEPVGKINERRDGAVWAKAGDGDWKQIRDGNKAAGPAGQPSVPRPAAVGPAQDANPWSVHQKKYGLDGHLPDPTIHAQHVHLDTEGDIDTKPVMSWVDESGSPRNSYTAAFHRHRSLAQREKIRKAGTESFRTAHAKLRSGMVTASSPRERDAHAIALIHLTGGHRISDILGMHAMHTATTLPHQGGDAPDSGVPDEVETEVTKSATSDPDNQFRTHMVLQHPRGHLYPVSHYDAGLADHLRSRVSERAGSPGLFDAGPDDVRKVLDSVGLSGIDETAMRHHAAMHMAADKLSKLPPVSLEQDYATGMSQLIENLRAVSDEIGANFGHDPAPEGMSYVPPVVAAAYTEEAGGAKHWPKVFRRVASDETQEVEKSACTSPNVDTRSSSGASPTTSVPSDKTSLSTTQIGAPPPKTPTPSPLPSSTEEQGLEVVTKEVSQGVEPVVVPVVTGPDKQEVVVGPAQEQRDEHPFTGHISFQGIDIDVENVAGSYREGTDAGGKQWRIFMQAHYGEFRQGAGVDGDKLDVYVGPHAESPLVVVVRQTNPNTGAYDEDKVILGYLTADDAIEMYKRQYNRVGFYGGHSVMSIGALQSWLETRGGSGTSVPGTVSTQDQPVLVQHASEEDSRLRKTLHKMLGTQYPSPATALRKRLAEKALGRAVARARSGDLSIQDLDKAHQAYKSGDYRECCQILVAKSAGSAGSTGSVGSTGSTGSTGGTQKTGKRAETGSGGGKPGPDGVPVGTITTLSDGTQEQKVGPHEWRRISSGGKGSAPKQKQAPAEEPKSANPTIDVAVDELSRLRQRRATAESQELKLELDAQIEALRKRISKLKRGFGKSNDASQAKQRAQQGQTASRAPRDKRPDREESTKELAKSIRSAAKQHTAAPVSGLVPWYEDRERSEADEFNDFLARQDSVEMALINLAKSSPEFLVQANGIARKYGASGLKNYISARIGGSVGST